MYIDTAKSTIRGKTYTRYLLRESFRENGKVKHRTLANLSKVPANVIAIINAGLKGTMILKDHSQSIENVSLKQGPSFGAVFALASIAKRLKITAALGNSPFRKHLIWLIIARIIDQGSRLSASRLQKHHATTEVLGLDEPAVHKFYQALDWAADHQETIEKKLFNAAHASNSPKLFLYDVTSSYLEGTENELAAYGYNRDKKQGKKQIVIGLLTDDSGDPVAVRVFEGNRADPTTCLDQVKLLAESFNVTDVTLVGDRGMIKAAQITELTKHDFHYITAITRSQIETLVKSGIIQLDLFDTELTEVTAGDIRYILRRNPVRAKEIVESRQDKFAALQARVDRSNTYLAGHYRAHVETQLRNLIRFAVKLKISSWIKFDCQDRTIVLSQDLDRLEEASRFDGCYVIKTDLPACLVDKTTVHDRYKDLAKVENAFRTMKTECLEVRPVYVRNEKRTRGHVFLTMLAYKIVREIEHCTPDRKNSPVSETIDLLTQIMLVGLTDGDNDLYRIPTPDAETTHLLEQLRVSLPSIIPALGVEVL